MSVNSYDEDIYLGDDSGNRAERHDGFCAEWYNKGRGHSDG